jgi:hypothetical protein
MMERSLTHWGGAVLAAASSAVALGAQAAEIRPLRGEILVNSGAGYRVIEASVEIEVGSAIFARPQAHARLIYADGCSVEIVPGSVIWVRPRSPCALPEGASPPRDPEARLAPRVTFDPRWLRDGAPHLNRRKPPAGP